MDGSNPVILFTNSLDHVEFLTVDIRENKLYWAVTSTGTVGLLSPPKKERTHVLLINPAKISTD